MTFKILFVVIITTLMTFTFAYSEPVEVIYSGKVTFQNQDKLDLKAKKEIAAISAKIKKLNRKGTVKLIGDVPSAESQDEYITRTAFLARSVETYLRTLLPAKQQSYITAAKYGGEKKQGLNSVAILFYPYELRTEGAGFISSQITSEDLPKVADPIESPPVSVDTIAPAVAATDKQPYPEGGLLSPAPAENEQGEVNSKKEQTRELSEDANLANELVLKAKARAAEKAKRLEREK